MGGMDRRSQPLGVPAQLRRSQTPRVRMGNEEHQQSQRAHTKEIMLGRSVVFEKVHTPVGRHRTSEAGHMRQGS